MKGEYTILRTITNSTHLQLGVEGTFRF